MKRKVKRAEKSKKKNERQGSESRQGMKGSKRGEERGQIATPFPGAVSMGKEVQGATKPTTGYLIDRNIRDKRALSLRFGPS
jgi:hypothetical protein